MIVYYRKLYLNDLESYKDSIRLHTQYVDTESYWKDELYFFSSKLNQQEINTNKEPVAKNYGKSSSFYGNVFNPLPL